MYKVSALSKSNFTLRFPLFIIAVISFGITLGLYTVEVILTIQSIKDHTVFETISSLYYFSSLVLKGSSTPNRGKRLTLKGVRLCHVRQE